MKNLYAYKAGSGIRGAALTGYAHASKVVLALLDEIGPMSTEMLCVTSGLSYPMGRSQVTRPLEPLLHKGVVERIDVPVENGGIAAYYRVKGDVRDWLCNQLHKGKVRRKRKQHHGGANDTSDRQASQPAAVQALSAV